MKVPQIVANRSKIKVWASIVLCTYLLTYLLTPYSTVLLKQLTGSQLVKKFPAFYGTRGFITAFTASGTGLYPEPTPSSLHPLPLPEDPF